MPKITLSFLPTYDPDRLLDELKVRMHLKNDARLARALCMPSPCISKLRHRAMPVSAYMLIQMHEVSKLTIRELRYLMGDDRPRFNPYTYAPPAPKPKRLFAPATLSEARAFDIARNSVE